MVLHYVVMDVGGKNLRGWFSFGMEAIRILYGDSVKLIKDIDGAVVYRRARKRK